MLGLFVHSRVDTANTRDSGADDNCGGADQKERDFDGKRKGKHEENKNADKQNPRKRAAEKSVFAVGACGEIPAEKRCGKKRDQRKNWGKLIGVLHGKPRETGDNEKNEPDGK